MLHYYTVCIIISSHAKVLCLHCLTHSIKISCLCAINVYVDILPLFHGNLPLTHTVTVVVIAGSMCKHRYLTSFLMDAEEAALQLLADRPDLDRETNQRRPVGKGLSEHEKGITTIIDGRQDAGVVTVLLLSICWLSFTYEWFQIQC